MSSLRAPKQRAHKILVAELLRADVVSDKSERPTEVQLQLAVSTNKLTLCKCTATAATGRNHAEMETMRNNNWS